MVSKKKRKGRPRTHNPLDQTIAVRLSLDDSQRFKAYCRAREDGSRKLPLAEVARAILLSAMAQQSATISE